MSLPSTVFFDVDFTLIHPGPRFQGGGYQQTCASHGVIVDSLRFEEAVAGAAPLLESGEHVYDEQVFEVYTQRIIELMGGGGPGVIAAARELSRDWAEHCHFTLYPDVPDALRRLDARGIRIGLISNTHRCLASFQTHFALDGLIRVAVSSSEHGFMKPHPSIFQEALDRMGAAASESAMVGDSLVHDVVGAVEAGWRGVWLSRRGTAAAGDPRIAVIRSLDELPALWE